eukprot:5696035-Amphidinium_carterae.1
MSRLLTAREQGTQTTSQDDTAKGEEKGNATKKYISQSKCKSEHTWNRYFAHPHVSSLSMALSALCHNQVRDSGCQILELMASITAWQGHSIRRGG